MSSEGRADIPVIDVHYVLERHGLLKSFLDVLEGGLALARFVN